jgi:two-component system chemotaxis response regulator CheB
MTIGEHSYRCHVGHAWTSDALLDARDDEVEGALWVALRSLQEKAKLSRRLADKFGHGRMHRRYMEIADEAEHALKVLGNRLTETAPDQGERGAG